MSVRHGYLAGLIGSGVGPSLTPELHMTEAAAQGLTYLYRTIDLHDRGLPPESVGSLVRHAQYLGYDGLNITHPCKQLVIPALDGLDPRASELNAVNTVVFGRQGAVGHNTDWSGFADSFRRDLGDVNKNRVVQLGGGGAGAAVAHAMLTLEAGQLSIFDLDTARAQHLAHKLRVRFGADRAAAVTDLTIAMATSDGLVHATPTGMARHPGLPLSPTLLRPAHWVAEIVYFPLETELVRVARARGCRTMNGSGMAVFQAAKAFRLFTGLEPDVERMQLHFNSMGTS